MCVATNDLDHLRIRLYNEVKKTNLFVKHCQNRDCMRYSFLKGAHVYHKTTEMNSKNTLFNRFSSLYVIALVR